MVLISLPWQLQTAFLAMPWQYLNGNLQAPYQDRELAIIKTCSTFRPPRVPDCITKYDPLEPKRFITCQWSWPPFQMFHVNALVVRSWKTANTLAILGGRGLFPPPPSSCILLSFVFMTVITKRHKSIPMRTEPLTKNIFKLNHFRIFISTVHHENRHLFKADICPWWANFTKTY